MQLLACRTLSFIFFQTFLEVLSVDPTANYFATLCNTNNSYNNRLFFNKCFKKPYDLKKKHDLFCDVKKRNEKKEHVTKFLL